MQPSNIFNTIASPDSQPSRLKLCSTLKTQWPSMSSLGCPCTPKRILLYGKTMYIYIYDLYLYHIRTEYTSTSLLCAITNLLPQKTKINLKIISLPTIPFHSIVLLKASTQSPFSINQYKLEVYPQTSAQDVVAQSSEPNGVQTPKLVRVNGLSPHAATTLQNPNNHSLTKLLPRTPCRHLHAMASK